MNRGFSLYLDTVRFIAALVVLLSHWAYPRFTGGDYIWIRELNLGSDAVVVFFVLSGLVIAFAARERDRDGQTFLFNRATRLYSVVLPALVLTFAMDRLGAAFWPAAYDGWWYNGLPALQYFFSGLTLSNEWGITGLRLGTNGPYWSLSYEAAYYLLFAAAFFLRSGVRVVTLFALVLIIGYKPLLLMPAWLLGVGIWKVISRDGFKINPVLAWALAVVPVLGYGACLAIDVPAMLMAVTETATGLTASQINAFVRFSDEFLWNNLLALLVALNFLGVAALCKAGELPKTPESVRRFLVWGAGGSFSLYVVHYPLLQFADSALEQAHVFLGRDAVLLAISFIGCMAFAAVFERRLGTFRRVVQGGWTLLRKDQAVSPQR